MNRDLRSDAISWDYTQLHALSQLLLQILAVTSIQLPINLNKEAEPQLYWLGIDPLELEPKRDSLAVHDHLEPGNG
jgi:hypothetical protein